MRPKGHTVAEIALFNQSCVAGGTYQLFHFFYDSGLFFLLMNHYYALLYSFGGQ